ncbi:MAG: hypothetical protein ACE5I2_12360 [Anaerolineae bacterium]
MLTSKLIRWSGLACMVGGLLHGVSRVILAALGLNLPESASKGTRGAWVIWWTLLVISFMLIQLGLAGLYASQAQGTRGAGLIGFLLASIGTTLAAGVGYTSAFAVPSVMKEAPALPSFVEISPFFEVQLLSYLVFALGWCLLGIATVRARVLPRWAGVLLTVGGVLSLAPWAVIGPVVLGLALVWMGYTLWSGTSEVAGQSGE